MTNNNKTYAYDNYPSGIVYITWEEVIAEFYDTWKEKAAAKGGIELTEENCIQDWIVINWAWEVKPHNNKNPLNT